MWLYLFARKHLNTYYSHIRYTCTLEHRYCYVYAWVVLTHSAHYIQCSILSTNTVFTDYFIPYHILDREWSSENYPLFDIIMHFMFEPKQSNTYRDQFNFNLCYFQSGIILEWAKILPMRTECNAIHHILWYVCAWIT